MFIVMLKQTKKNKPMYLNKSDITVSHIIDDTTLTVTVTCAREPSLSKLIQTNRFMKVAFESICHLSLGWY